MNWSFLYLQESFQTLKNWVKELRQHGPPNIVVAIAGNKCDLSDARWTRRTDRKHLQMFSRCYKLHLRFFMDPQGSVREGCQGLCRLHPRYLRGNQCQERHQHQRSVHRDKWVCFSNTWRLWTLTPCLRGAAFKAFHIRIRCFWPNLCSSERGGKKHAYCTLKNLTVWELRAFCHHFFFPPVAHVSLSPFSCQSSCDPSSSEAP